MKREKSVEMNTGLLMIEPSDKISAVPLVDDLTRRMTAAWRRRRSSPDGERGYHICACGAESDNRDHWVTVGAQRLLTNALCVHYLAFHRAEVPQEELNKVRALAHGMEEPNEEEFARPKR